MAKQKAKYEVAKVEGKWGVNNRETGEHTPSETNSRSAARTMKQGLEPSAPREHRAAAAKAATKPAKATKATKATKAQVKQVEVANGDKVEGITAGNYAANLARAKALKARLKKHYEKTGGFPSHRYIINTWGFNISLKAIIRHKKNLKVAMGLAEDAEVPTTSQLPRPKKVAATA